MAARAAPVASADPMAFSHHHHRALLADFLEIEQDRDTKVSGREALNVHNLIDALLRSAEVRGSVTTVRQIAG